jgi:hypothetical protein
MAATKEELIERAQIVRLYEANTTIAVPSELDLRFRRALMIKLATEYSLPKRKLAQTARPPAAKPAARVQGKAF